MRKICPICDGKISGKFCKTCRQFVTPIEISSNCYINERHSDSDVPHTDCDYHNVKPQKTYTNTTYNTNSANTKKSGCGPKLVVALIFIIMVSSCCIIPIVNGFFDAASEGIIDIGNEEEVQTETTATIEMKALEYIYEDVTLKKPEVDEFTSGGEKIVVYGDGYFIVQAYEYYGGRADRIVITENSLLYTPDMIEAIVLEILGSNMALSDEQLNLLKGNINKFYENPALWSTTEKKITYHNIVDVTYCKNDETYEVEIEIVK